MSTLALPMVPAPGTASWVVPIDMPVYESGKHRGRPVGWLTSNNRPASREGGIFQGKRRSLWRQKSYATYLTHRLHLVTVPSGRVLLQFQFQFVNGIHPDLSNLGDTTKPIIDALQPDGSYLRKGKRVELPGIGMIPNDTHEWVVIGAQLPVLPNLGPNSRIGGRVVVTITPLPAAPQPTT